VSITCYIYYCFYEFYANNKDLVLKRWRKDDSKILPTEQKAELIYNEIFHLFTLHKKPIIWLFWDNFTTIPPYISLSFELIQCHNIPDLNVIILNQTTVKEYVKEFPPAYDYLLKVHQADYIRCRLLKEYGGMWIDADTIQFAPVRYLFDYLQNFDVFGYWWPGKKIPCIKNKHRIFSNIEKLLFPGAPQHVANFGQTCMRIKFRYWAAFKLLDSLNVT
jgi:hypothetical protein